MPNLTKENIRKSSALELTFRHAYLMDQIEQLPPGAEISPEKKKAKAALEEELRRRLYLYLKGDVLPIIVTTIKAIKEKPKIPFNFDVLSMLNTRVDRFKVEAITKEEAWEKARKRALTYPSQVNLKIS